MTYALNVNGRMHSVDVDGDIPLLWVLRDVIGLTGTKFGCGIGICGACTVHFDGQAVRSCVTSIEHSASSEITTIEEVGETATGARIQQAWLAEEVVQCGYCSPARSSRRRSRSRSDQALPIPRLRARIRPVN
ncbi:(2Fe-2S)-binding protein [Inquilinus limosus]|uniref:(2Fe-2S)-binding protein n=1 Tax=Inquilinus limosus TaxID=171674 RepID=UPI003F5CCC4D